MKAQRLKRATIGSETDKSRMKRAPIGSETETGDEQSWRELMQQEEATYSLTERKDKAYKFNCKPSNLQTWMADSRDISNITGCVEAVFRSHLYTTITAMQYCYTKMVPIPQFVVWVGQIGDRGRR